MRRSHKERLSFVDEGTTCMALKEADFARTKSGVIISVSDGDFGTVQFYPNPNDRFINSPHVVLTLHGPNLATDIPILSYVTTNGFEWNIHKGHGGQAHTWDIYWIATDAG